MDRRDALKKLGMGGITAVGASLIVSAPAFGATTPTTPTPSASTNVAETVATFSLGLNDPQCTGGSDPVGTVVENTSSFNTNFGGIVNGLQVTAPNGRKFKNNETVTLNLSTTSTCSYSNATEAPVSANYQFIFDWVPSVKNFVVR